MPCRFKQFISLTWKFICVGLNIEKFNFWSQHTIFIPVIFERSWTLNKVSNISLSAEEDQSTWSKIKGMKIVCCDQKLNFSIIHQLLWGPDLVEVPMSWWCQHVKSRHQAHIIVGSYYTNDVLVFEETLLETVTLNDDIRWRFSLRGRTMESPNTMARMMTVAGHSKDLDTKKSWKTFD